MVNEPSVFKTLKFYLVEFANSPDLDEKAHQFALLSLNFQYKKKKVKMSHSLIATGI